VKGSEERFTRCCSGACKWSGTSRQGVGEWMLHSGCTLYPWWMLLLPAVWGWCMLRMPVLSSNSPAVQVHVVQPTIASS
jgi:hypothetical protein